MVWTAAVKIAYIGEDFMGSQRQPRVRTVEGEVLRALMKLEAIDNASDARFRVASRTDRGVNALGNVVCFDTGFSKEDLMRAMNAVIEDVYCYAMTEVPSDFSPRRAKQRWYRYMLLSHDIDVERFRQCADLFMGRHDFKHFCKPEGKATVKTIDSIEVTPIGDTIVIDLRAREFLRNMVRRTVAAMESVGQGRSALEEVEGALQGKAASFGLAKPEGLTLMDITYDIEFAADIGDPYLARRTSERRQKAMSELLFFDTLAERFKP